MSLQAFELVLPDNDDADGDVKGVAIVDSVTGLCLALPVGTFIDADEAEYFLLWALPERRAQLLEDPASSVRAWREQDDETTQRDDAA